jgi:hypothetical protein
MQQQFSEIISQAGANVKRTAPVKPVFQVPSDWYKYHRAGPGMLIRPSDMQSFFLLLAAALGASAAVTSRAPLEINTPCAVPFPFPFFPYLTLSTQRSRCR